jgi:hypothetical protein
MEWPLCNNLPQENDHFENKLNAEIGHYGQTLTALGYNKLLRQKNLFNGNGLKNPDQVQKVDTRFTSSEKYIITI